MKKSKILSTVWDYFLLTVGVALYAFAWGSFVIPNGMSAGGFTGLCTIIQMATNGAIPVSISYAVLNIFVLVAGFFILGHGFGFKTIYCVALSTLMLQLWSMFPSVWAVEGNFLYLPEKFFIPIIAGLLEALSVAIIFTQGGSTGGTDIVALVVNKYWPISPGKMFIMLDIFIIASIALVPGKGFSDMVYGYLMMITFSFMLDAILMGRQSSVKVLVFSKEYEKIADHIINVMDRGATVLSARGWYTKEEKPVLLILVRGNELSRLKKEIKEIDPKAFLSVSKTSAVYGEGFDEIKTGLKKKKNNDRQ